MKSNLLENNATKGSMRPGAQESLQGFAGKYDEKDRELPSLSAKFDSLQTACNKSIKENTTLKQAPEENHTKRLDDSEHVHSLSSSDMSDEEKQVRLSHVFVQNIIFFH